MARLTAKRRKRLSASAFVYPSTRSYPIHDLAHARNALSRAAQKKTSGTYAAVKAAVCRRYPTMPACKTSRRRSTSSRRRRR